MLCRSHKESIFSQFSWLCADPTMAIKESYLSTIGLIFPTLLAKSPLAPKPKRVVIRTYNRKYSARSDFIAEAPRDSSTFKLTSSDKRGAHAWKINSSLARVHSKRMDFIKRKMWLLRRSKYDKERQIEKSKKLSKISKRATIISCHWYEYKSSQLDWSCQVCHANRTVYSDVTFESLTHLSLLLLAAPNIASLGSNCGPAEPNFRATISFEMGFEIKKYWPHQRLWAFCLMHVWMYVYEHLLSNSEKWISSCGWTNRGWEQDGMFGLSN